MGPIQLPTFNYFKNGNGWLGSAGLLRFQIEKPADEAMTVVLWQGPFSRPYAQEIGRESFPLSEEGLEAIKAFLADKAQALTEHPAFTPAETTAYYQEKKAQEQAPAEDKPAS